LTGVHNSQRRASRKRRFWIVTAVLLILALAGLIVFRGIGRWLVVQDPLEHSDAIVVLSGGMPQRALEAARIYRQGMAPEVWITRPASPSESLGTMGISFEGEESYSRAILVHEGVPETAIRILTPVIVNTVDEERATIAEMQATRASRVIIVTSPPHTRRVRTLWRKLAPAGLVLIVRPATEDGFDADHWWRTTQDSLAVVRETLGLLNAWAGLPVQPASH
jgi:uncharacterized SAM-binding protein YcdF (DUF218 family)